MMTRSFVKSYSAHSPVLGRRSSASAGSSASSPSSTPTPRDGHWLSLNATGTGCFAISEFETNRRRSPTLWIPRVSTIICHHEVRADEPDRSLDALLRVVLRASGAYATGSPSRPFGPCYREIRALNGSRRASRSDIGTQRRARPSASSTGLVTISPVIRPERRAQAHVRVGSAHGRRVSRMVEEATTPAGLAGMSARPRVQAPRRIRR
jgi:hypothetical protein